MKRINCLLLVLLLLGGIAARASERYMQERYSNEEGLSNNSVNCFCEDSRHCLWIGTWDGLNRYDGRTFRVHRHHRNDPASIGNNVIRQILEQDSLTMWIVTNDCISRWDQRTQRFTNYRPGCGETPPKEPALFVMASARGGMLVCVKHRGFYLAVTDNEETRFIPVRGGETAVSSMVLDRENRLYLLTESRRVWRYRLVAADTDNPVLSDPEPIETERSVSELLLADEVPIINCEGHPETVDPRTRECRPLSTELEQVGRMACRNGKLYLTAPRGEKLVRCDLHTGRSERIDSLPSRTRIFSLYAGTQEIVWVGTDGRGILKIFEYTTPFRTVRTSYPVRCFVRSDDNTLLVGTKGEGIKLFDKRSRRIVDEITTASGLISDRVYGMRKNGRGDIFIGTEGSDVNYLLRGTRRPLRLRIPIREGKCKSIYSLAFTHGDSLLWLGTSGSGLVRVRLERRANGYVALEARQYRASGVHATLGSNIIYAIVRDADPDILWLGTRGGGVVRFDTRTERFENFHDETEVGNDVLSMIRGMDRTLWIGTSYGLDRLTRNEEGAVRIDAVEDKGGLDDQAVHGIVEDTDGHLWLSTGNGIVRIDRTSGATTRYTSRNGLQNDEFSDGAYFRDNETDIFFGGVAGFSYFNPQMMQLRDFEPRIRLSDLRINNKEQPLHERVTDNELKLSYNEAHVALTFSIGEMINNENCVLEYRITNLSDAWIYNDNNPTVTITRLPPGCYHLEVRYTNGERVWSPHPYLLTLRIGRPWWLGGWAFAAYLVAAALIAAVACAVIRNRIRLNRRLLLEHIEKQQQQKMHESQLNFFENIAHEFFTPLTLIYGPAQQLLDRAGLDNYAKRYLQVIKNNADRMQRLLNELMEFRKAETGHTALRAEPLDLRLLLHSVVDNYTELAGESRIDFEVRIDPMPQPFTTDRSALEKILFNLISNAFKYTPEGGRIGIRLEALPEDTIRLRIRNSGRGLTEKQCAEAFDRFRIFEHTQQRHALSTGIGLSLTKGLTELLGGRISVSSDPGTYVEFEVVLPSMPGTRTPEEPPSPMPELPAVVRSGRQRATVLIVEDDRHIRELLYDILSPQYFVLEAADGERGLEVLRQNLPDLVLSDIVMPGLDGIGLIDRLRADERTAHIPIVSISAKLSIEDRIAAVEHGADAYITKPFHPRHILATIEQLLSKRSVLKEYFNSARSDVTVREGITLRHEDERMLQEIVAFIENNIDDEALNPTSISDFIGIGKTSLYEKLKELTGKTPGEYIRTVRLDCAAKLLRTTRLTVQEIMYKSGFGSKSYFYKEFTARFGASPKEYRKGDAPK